MIGYNIERLLGNPEEINEKNIRFVYRQVTNGNGSSGLDKALELLKTGTPTSRMEELVRSSRESYRTCCENPMFNSSEAREALFIVHGKALSINRELMEKTR